VDGATEELAARARFVDFTFGTGSIRELPSLISRALAMQARPLRGGGQPQNRARGPQANKLPQTPQLREAYETAAAGGAGTAAQARGLPQRRQLPEALDVPETAAQAAPMRRKPPPCALVSVMTGCDNFCAYCIVPHVRGREISRAPQAILAEAEALAKAGYKEITLLGQNVNSYGKGNFEPGIPEFGGGESARSSGESCRAGSESARTCDGESARSCGESARAGDNSNRAGIAGAPAPDFAELLLMLERIRGIERIRFMTSHPKDLSDRLIGAISGSAKICRHIHLPVQSGSSAVLKRMNRAYTRDEYMSLVAKIRRAAPGIAITTDIIVGFPGETEQDFEDTLDLVARVEFDMAYTFMYSKRRGTPAADFDGQISHPAMKARFDRLLALQSGISLRKNMELVGTRAEVLCEGFSKNNPSKYAGRTSGGKIANFSSECPLKAGQMAIVAITGAHSWSLSGTAERLC
jgi:tRNA-2-methylthio-N6-dimethylallyladenosine synthase